MGFHNRRQTVPTEALTDYFGGGRRVEPTVMRLADEGRAGIASRRDCRLGNRSGAASDGSSSIVDMQEFVLGTLVIERGDDFQGRRLC